MPTVKPRRSQRRARLYGLLLCLCGLGVATALVLFALRDNLSYFRTPTEVVLGTYPERASGRAFRLGGLVVAGSLAHDGAALRFRVTDLHNDLAVTYAGTVPDLFREGQGVVAEGRMAGDGVFDATTLLAKHDEKYMPPEVARAMKTGASAP